MSTEIINSPTNIKKDLFNNDFKEKIKKENQKKYVCIVCQSRFESTNELVSHFQNNCNPAALMSVSNTEGLPVFSRNPEPSPPVEESESIKTNNNEKLHQNKTETIQKNSSTKVDTSKIYMDLSARLSAPILLPVAMHDGDGIKVLGSPQFIIPIAVSKDTLIENPIIKLHPQLCKNIKVQNEFPLSNGIPGSYIKIIESTSNNSSNTIPINSPTVSMNNNTSIRLPIKRKNDDVTPLDLSKKIPKITPTLPIQSSINISKSLPNPLMNYFLNQSVQYINTGISKQNEKVKNYKCTCGIEFTSEKTYEGHKNYYCRFRPHADDDNNNKQNNNKAPENCPHCEFTPSSSSQLSQHIRQQHSPGKCYICGLCSYRGYSIRGIRCHVKEHMINSGTAGAELETIVNNLYTEIPTNTKTNNSDN